MVVQRDNRSVTHIYNNIYSCQKLSYSLTSEVAAYLPLFYRQLLRGFDCGVELRCHLVTRPLVGCER